MMSQSSRATRADLVIKIEFSGRTEEERIDLAPVHGGGGEGCSEGVSRQEEKPLALARTGFWEVLKAVADSLALLFFPSPLLPPLRRGAGPRLFLRDNESQGRVRYHITSGSRFPRLNAPPRQSRSVPPRPAIKKFPPSRFGGGGAHTFPPRSISAETSDVAQTTPRLIQSYVNYQPRLIESRRLLDAPNRSIAKRDRRWPPIIR